MTEVERLEQELARARAEEEARAAEAQLAVVIKVEPRVQQYKPGTCFECGLTIATNTCPRCKQQICATDWNSGTTHNHALHCTHGPSYMNPGPVERPIIPGSNPPR